MVGVLGLCPGLVAWLPGEPVRVKRRVWWAWVIGADVRPKQSRPYASVRSPSIPRLVRNRQITPGCQDLGAGTVGHLPIAHHKGQR